MATTLAKAFIQVASGLQAPVDFDLTNPVFAGLVTESATDNITAFAGGGQASAVQLTTEINRVATVATAGDSVKLPASVPGLTIVVINGAAKAMQVFGAGTDTIDGVASATGVSQMPKSMVIYSCPVAGQWISEGLATGYSGSLQTLSTVDGLVAHAGGGQGSATPLTAMLNKVATCATGGDSSLLPVSAAGMTITVTNGGAASMNVFPSTGEQINALGANNAFAVAAGKTASFYCYTAGQWHALLSA